MLTILGVNIDPAGTILDKQDTPFPIVVGDHGRKLNGILPFGLPRRQPSDRLSGMKDGEVVIGRCFGLGSRDSRAPTTPSWEWPA